MAYGAQEGNRTPDLRITSALLYRLSYLGRNSILPRQNRSTPQFLWCSDTRREWVCLFGSQSGECKESRQRNLYGVNSKIGAFVFFSNKDENNRSYERHGSSDDKGNFIAVGYVSQPTQEKWSTCHADHRDQIATGCDARKIF